MLASGPPVFPDCESPANHSKRLIDAIYMRYPQWNHYMWGLVDNFAHIWA